MKKTIGIILTLPTLGFIVGAAIYSLNESPIEAVISLLLYISFTIGVILINQ